MNKHENTSQLLSTQILQDIKTAKNDVPNLVKLYPEFSCETHKVTTCDGYILTIHRIRYHNSDKNTDNQKKLPVLLQHGLLADSALWILNGGNKNSLGFALALAGYDVWMANSRGNTYSREHESMSGWNPLHLKYWDFSFEDMALYDLPATIDYILGETNNHQIHYVGHSQGTLIMFMAMDEYGIDFQDKIASFSAIAPIAFMINATSPLANFARGSLASTLCYTNVYAVVGQKYTGIIGDYLVQKFTDSLVSSSQKIGGSDTLLAKVVGFYPERYHSDKIQGYVKHISSGTSIKDLFHFGQIIRAGKPTKFCIRDWKFSVLDTKKYNLENIVNKKIFIYCGLDDSLSHFKDVSVLEDLLKLKNEVKREDFVDYDHMSLVWAKDVHEKVNKKIIQSLENFE